MGKSQRNKGYRGEAEFAEKIGGQRVPLSGAMEGYDNDVVGLGMRWEVKWRGDGFKELYKWLAGNKNEAPPDALGIKADRKQWLVVIPLERFKEMVKGG